MDWWKFGKECHRQDDILRLLATSEGDVLEDDTLVDKAEDTFWDQCVCVCVSMLVTLTVRGSHCPFSGQSGVMLKLAFILCKRLHEQI